MRGRQNKYRNVPTVIDGIRFASKAEACRYRELALLERAGQISQLVLQPRYSLVADGIDASGCRVLGEYVGDFQYQERGETVVEDVKGVLTPLCAWKLKHLKAQYGIEVRLIGRRWRAAA